MNTLCLLLTVVVPEVVGAYDVRWAFREVGHRAQLAISFSCQPQADNGESLV